MFGKQKTTLYCDGKQVEGEYLTQKDFSGFAWSVGLVNHYKKTISPVHGYYYPNPTSLSLMKRALKLGYTYVDCEMPKHINKTLK